MSRKSETIAPPEPKGMRSKAKYAAINVFLVFHIVTIACWCIPIGSPLTLGVRQLVRPYFVWSGLFQSWDMFAPNPKTANSYVEAIVIYQDGSTELWSFPRMELMTLAQAYVKERYRKFEENLENDEFSALWPDAARYIARLKSNHASPPKTIMLVVRWSQILPPQSGSYDRGPWDANVFYKYDVKTEDLR